MTREPTTPVAVTQADRDLRTALESVGFGDEGGNAVLPEVTLRMIARHRIAHQVDAAGVIQGILDHYSVAGENLLGWLTHEDKQSIPKTRQRVAGLPVFQPSETEWCDWGNEVACRAYFSALREAKDALTTLQREGQLCDRNDALREENERLRSELAKANAPQWFYLGVDCDSSNCRFCIDECISEDFEWDNKPEGDHVLQISGARSVPDMWVALHYFTESEKDARKSDDDYTYTIHETEELARAALEGEGR